VPCADYERPVLLVQLHGRVPPGRHILVRRCRKRRM
jgi:hypothetical protein